MNKALKLIAGAAVMVLSSSAFAQLTVGQSFNVTATLAARCETANATPTALNFGTYTAFGSAQFAAPTTDISFKCTKNITAPTASLGTGGTAGSVAGLAYTLALGTGVKTAPTGHDLYTYTITGTMAAGQAGDATAALAAAQVHTLTITY